MSSAFKPNQLVWPIVRTKRSFRVHVVEPRAYEPALHAEFFNTVLDELISPSDEAIDAFTNLAIQKSDDFGLVTFPEAFVTPDALVSVLEKIPQLQGLGCVHVGLRSVLDADRHLFRQEEVVRLVRSIRTLSVVVGADLDQFEQWLNEQHRGLNFNIGCLFTLDSSQRVRVCLHGKMVRSKYEISGLKDSNMAEANLLTIVTLRPDDPKLFTVTIQPLICSDALPHDTDRPGGRPLDALHQHADCFDQMVPDHVDIVSVSTCTPQQRRSSGSGEYFQWHEHFRMTLSRAASDDTLARHRFATFVLANYTFIPGDDKLRGGLSGAFLPLPLKIRERPAYVSFSTFGRVIASKDECWVSEHELPECYENSTAHLASLDLRNLGATADVAVMSFTIHRLLRDSSIAKRPDGLIDYGLRLFRRSLESGELKIERKD